MSPELPGRYPMFRYSATQRRNGRWRILRTYGLNSPELRCEQKDYATQQEAMQELLDELKARGIDNYGFK